jgi:quinol monooxygenase YgiN
MKVKPGKTKEVIAIFEKWAEEQRPNVPDSVGGYLLQPDNKVNELVALAVFKDEKSYRDNSETSEQGQWYESLRALLTADPEWEDGKVVAVD